MVRIVFINPPIRTTDPPRHVPYGLAQLAAVADRWGAQVGVYDMNISRTALDVMRDELSKEADSYGEWDIIAFGGLVTTYGWQKDAATALKKAFPKSLIITGGGCASSLHDDMLKWILAIDAVSIGEGEKTLEEILKLAAKGEHMHVESLRKVPGLYIKGDLDKFAGLGKTHKGRKITKARKKKKDERVTRQAQELLNKRDDIEIIFTGFRPLMSEEELNKLPFPSWGIFPLEKTIEGNQLVPGYFDYSRVGLSAQALLCTRRLDVIWERGCPWNCRFCSHNLMGGDDLPDGNRLKPFVRWFSPKYMVNMIEHIRKKFRIDFFSVQDETFMANKKRIHEFLDLYEERGLVLPDLKWGCLGRAEKTDPEFSVLLQRMYEAGCTYISFGFESAHQPHLDYLKKENTVEDQRNTLKAVVDARINPITTYIVGYPDETMQSLYDTARFWVIHGIQCTPFFLTPYPYTKIYWENEAKILAQYDGDKEKFILALGDATDFVVNLTKRFNDVELLGLRDLMARHDLDRLRAYAKWRQDEFSLDPKFESIVDPDPPKPQIKRQIFPETPEGGFALV